MSTYRVRVERKQSWTFTVEANDTEAAKAEGDRLATEEWAHDDWSYDTTATLVYAMPEEREQQ